MTVVVNPDKEYADEIKKRIKDNGGYCPCRLQKIPENKCRCKEFREQVKKNIAGACHCGLWIAT